MTTTSTAPVGRPARRPFSLGYLPYLIPGLLGYLVIIAIPFFTNLGLSFTSWAGIGDPRGFPVLLFFLSLFSLVTLPITNTLIRVDESEADLYSLKTENRPDALATALVKTAEYRNPRPGAVEETIFYDHPSVERRVRVAMDWKAAHPPAAE